MSLVGTGEGTKGTLWCWISLRAGWGQLAGSIRSSPSTQTHPTRACRTGKGITLGTDKSWGGEIKAKCSERGPDDLVTLEEAPGRRGTAAPRHPRAHGHAWKGTRPGKAPGASCSRALLSSGDLGAAPSEAALSALKGSVPLAEHCSRAPKCCISS